jgi:uncharacterized membrane protein
MQPKRAQTGALAWYKLGWQWFMANPVTWILLMVAYFLILLAFNVIPFLGSLLGAILWPGLSAGLLYAAKKSSEGVTISVGDLFVPLMHPESRFGLLHLGMISLAVAFVSGFAIYTIGGEGVVSIINQTNPADMSEQTVAMMQEQLPMLFSIMIIVSAVTAVLFMYAIPLITFEGVPAFTAVKASIWASIVNMFPLWLFGTLYLVFALLASLPFMLGFLVLMPVTICAWYASYLDIFDQGSETDMTAIV